MQWSGALAGELGTNENAIYDCLVLALYVLWQRSYVTVVSQVSRLNVSFSEVEFGVIALSENYSV